MALALFWSERFADHQPPRGHPGSAERAAVMRAVVERWRAAGGLVLVPAPATRAQLLRVRAAGYLDRPKASSTIGNIRGHRWLTEGPVSDPRADDSADEPDEPDHTPIMASADGLSTATGLIQHEAPRYGTRLWRADMRAVCQEPQERQSDIDMSAAQPASAASAGGPT